MEVDDLDVEATTVEESGTSGKSTLCSLPWACFQQKFSWEGEGGETFRLSQPLLLATLGKKESSENDSECSGKGHSQKKESGWTGKGHSMKKRVTMWTVAIYMSVFWSSIFIQWKSYIRFSDLLAIPQHLLGSAVAHATTYIWGATFSKTPANLYSF